MGAFQLEFDALDVDRPELGRVALVPWESETFGFESQTSKSMRAGRARQPLIFTARWTAGFGVMACSWLVRRYPHWPLRISMPCRLWASDIWTRRYALPIAVPERHAGTIGGNFDLDA
jgi:hypothetical protein